MNVSGQPNPAMVRRPVQAGGGFDPAMGQLPAAPVAYPQAPATAGPTAGELLANVFNGIVALLKNLFQSIASLFGPRSSASPPASTPFPGAPSAPSAPTVPAAPAPATWQVTAQQYGLYPSEQNVQAFLAEARQNQTEGALGPGSPASQPIRDLQSALASWGYRLATTGVYDESTQAAVVAFKRNEGIVQSYRAADGTWAVNGLADARTLERMMQKLQARVPAQPQSPVQAQPQPAAPAQPNLSAIAAQYRLLDTPENVQAFLAEVQRYPVDGALGPGSTNQKAIQDLQGALAILGFQVPASGSYDTATQQAVVAYKQSRGLRQGYRSADGQFAVNEYADSRMLDTLMNELQARMQQQGTLPAPTAPAATSQQSGIIRVQPAPIIGSTPAAAPFVPQAPVMAAPTSQQSGIIRVQPAPIIGSAPAATPLMPQAPVIAPQPGVTLPQPAPQVAAQATPAPDTAAIAARYRLLNTAENVQAFMAEVRSYQQAGALGPGSTQTQPIKDLQTILARLGFAVSPSGQYDEATSQAVVAYKQKFGLHNSYRAADGGWAVNEYADPAMLDDVARRIENQLGKAS
ncbi:MAG: peptidoglycan-binding protein [bacterium]|nr:peptidoglycan-binding protein [bacterium]